MNILDLPFDLLLLIVRNVLAKSNRTGIRRLRLSCKLFNSSSLYILCELFDTFKKRNNLWISWETQSYVGRLDIFTNCTGPELLMHIFDRLNLRTANMRYFTTMEGANFMRLGCKKAHHTPNWNLSSPNIQVDSNYGIFVFGYTEVGYYASSVPQSHQIYISVVPLRKIRKEGFFSIRCNCHCQYCCE